MNVRSTALLLGLIVAGGLTLRLVGASTAGLMFDESAHWAAAETIDVRPGQIHFIPRAVDHPPLSAYLLRASSLVFGTSNAGLRTGHVIIGTLTIVLVFLVSQRVFSTRIALWGAALIAVDRFHVTWSYFFMPEVLLLGFLTAALLFFARALEAGRPQDYVLYGLAIGLSYLAKETAAFFVVCLAVTTLAVGRFRAVWRSPWWYVGHALALGVVSFDLYWNLAHYYEGYFFRDHRLVAGSLSASPRALLLYVGDLVEKVVPPHVYSTGFSTQSPALCHWPAGLLYLGATLLAWWHRDGHWPRFLLLLFASGVFVFTALPGDGTNDAYWWASFTLIPGIMLAARLLDRSPRLVSLAIVGWFAVHSVMAVQRHTDAVPRQSAEERTATILTGAKTATEAGQLRRLEWELNWTMHIVPPNADIFAYQARLARDAGDTDGAAYFVRRSLELDPQQPIALQVRRELAPDGK